MHSLEDRKFQLREQLSRKVWDQLGGQLGSQLWSQLLDQLGVPFWRRLVDITDLYDEQEEGNAQLRA